MPSVVCVCWPHVQLHLSRAPSPGTFLFLHPEQERSKIWNEYLESFKVKPKKLLNSKEERWIVSSAIRRHANAASSKQGLQTHYGFHCAQSGGGLTAHQLAPHHRLQPDQPFQSLPANAPSKALHPPRASCRQTWRDLKLRDLEWTAKMEAAHDCAAGIPPCRE